MAQEFVLAMARIPQSLECPECTSAGRDCAPYPVRVRVRKLYFHALHVAEFIAYNRIEHRWVQHREQYQVDVRILVDRRSVGILRKPDGIGQSNEHRLIVTHKRLGAEERVTQAARLLLH